MDLYDDLGWTGIDTDNKETLPPDGEFVWLLKRGYGVEEYGPFRGRYCDRDNTFYADDGLAFKQISHWKPIEVPHKPPCRHEWVKTDGKKVLECYLCHRKMQIVSKRLEMAAVTKTTYDANKAQLKLWLITTTHRWSSELLPACLTTPEDAALQLRKYTQFPNTEVNGWVWFIDKFSVEYDTFVPIAAKSDNKSSNSD